MNPAGQGAADVAVSSPRPGAVGAAAAPLQRVVTQARN